MLGLFFVHISQDTRAEGRVNIRTGTVKKQVGSGHWLLEFKGKNFHFSNVLSVDALTNFQFFNTAAEAESFIKELIASSPEPLALPTPTSAAPLPS